MHQGATQQNSQVAILAVDQNHKFTSPITELVGVKIVVSQIMLVVTFGLSLLLNLP